MSRLSASICLRSNTTSSSRLARSARSPATTAAPLATCCARAPYRSARSRPAAALAWACAQAVAALRSVAGCDRKAPPVILNTALSSACQRSPKEGVVADLQERPRNTGQGWEMGLGVLSLAVSRAQVSRLLRKKCRKQTRKILFFYSFYKFRNLRNTIKCSWNPAIIWSNSAEYHRLELFESFPFIIRKSFVVILISFDELT